MTLVKRIQETARRLGRDDRGSVAAMSTVFLTVVLGMGVLVGVVVLRDHLVQEFGDFGVALDNLDQSFSYTINVCDDCTISAEYIDDAPTLVDPNGAAPACLVMDVDPSGEVGVKPAPSGDFP